MNKKSNASWWNIIDYPKTQAVYIREKINRKYLVTPVVQEGLEWVFEDGVRAVDKLHGTNICVWIEKGEIMAVDNRDNRLLNESSLRITMSKGTSRVLSGVVYAIERGWLKNVDNGAHYGELISPEINGNLHGVDRPMFVPFNYLKESCHWDTWVTNRYPKTFEAIEDWFKDLPSLFSKKILNKELLAEGLVFHHPDGRVAKLRRDMYEWYKKEKI